MKSEVFRDWFQRSVSDYLVFRYLGLVFKYGFQFWNFFSDREQFPWINQPSNAQGESRPFCSVVNPHVSTEVGLEKFSSDVTRVDLIASTTASSIFGELSSLPSAVTNAGCDLGFPSSNLG